MPEVSKAPVTTAQTTPTVTATPTPAATAPGSTTPVLRLGDQSPDVLRLQKSLTTVGYPVDATGFFGDKTLAQVIAFQANSGLVADGVVGQKTWAALCIEPGTPAHLAPMLGTLPELVTGTQGDAARWAQLRLVAHKVKAGIKVDGVYGAETAALVSSFQKAKKIPVTGRVDFVTWCWLILNAGPTKDNAPVLREGCRGAAVAYLQDRLVAHGAMQAADIGAGAGLFGPKTQRALEKFQAAKNLQATGVTDKATWARLING